MTHPVFANASSEEEMQANYELFLRQQDETKADEIKLPFRLDSDNTVSDSEASIRYLLDGVEFQLFADRMSQPQEWCEFIPLHLNIKACAYLQQSGQTYLQFYAGIKGYLPPDKAHLLQLLFQPEFDGGVFKVNLFARDGPLDSSDIDFRIRAIDVSRGHRKSVYMEFDLSSKPGIAANLMKIYLATVARNKVGFSVVGKTWRGKPRFIDGSRGATERNIVRYLLAIESYFATTGLSEQERFFERLVHWYSATDQFKRQLFELDRDTYIDSKIRERENQLILQKAIDSNSPPDFSVIDRNR